MKIHRIKRSSGETIVEVLVSVVVFLLLVAVLQGAIMFSNSAQKKSLQIRQDTAQICEKLMSAGAGEGSDAMIYDFYAVSSDGSVIGNQVFSIHGLKKQKEIEYTGTDGETSHVTFYLFGPDKSGPELPDGGTTP